MRECIRIYPFEVIDKINGNCEVYCIDRFEKSVVLARNLDITAFAKIKNHDNQDGRYEFYYIDDSDGFGGGI